MLSGDLGVKVKYMLQLSMLQMMLVYRLLLLTDYQLSLPSILRLLITFFEVLVSVSSILLI